MKIYLTILIFLIFGASFAWCAESMCKIMDLKGSVVYNGCCQYSGNTVITNKALSLNGVFFLDDKKNGISKKISIQGNKINMLSSLERDSSSVVENAAVKKFSNLGVLKKESSQSDEYYLRTNFFAINGIGYDSRRIAWDNFDSLFLYVKGSIYQQFPQDTISTKLIFNKTSGSKFTDIIQSLLLKTEELVIKTKKIINENDIFSKLSYWINLSSQCIVDELLPWIIGDENEQMIREKIDEFIELRDRFIIEELSRVSIVSENSITESNIKNDLMASANSKSRAIVLGHSQGGMYVYKAFDAFPDSVRKHFYSLNVAVPTSLNPNWYLINDNDWIVNAARLLLYGIPAGESNGPVDGGECKNDNFTHHAWQKSYYNPCLISYAKINAAIEDAFRTVPYWEKRKSARYHLVWYNGAAETTIEIAKADGSFETLGTYQGYDVTDPTVMDVPNVLLLDGVPLLRVTSYHRGSWWGPYLSNEPGFFKIISNDDGSLTYLMSDAWSQGSYDDAEFSITIIVE